MARAEQVRAVGPAKNLLDVRMSVKRRHQRIAYLLTLLR